jgi:Flp pilus assembly protein TadG
MIGFIRKLIKDRRGNALVIAGACLPLIVGAAGLATDTIQWTLAKRQLQRAADSAAIAGVYDRSGSAGSTATVATTVAHDLTLNSHSYFAMVSGYPQVTYPADTTTMKYQVAVKLEVQKSLPFSSLFMSAAPIIIANATAASVPAGGDACVQALETSSRNTGINITGNAGIYMPDCVMYSNSPASNSAAAGGSSNVTADSVATVGGVQQSNNWHVSAYRPYSPSLADPFAGVSPSPSDMKCAGHNETHGSNTTWVNDALTETTDMANALAADGSHANCWSSMSVSSTATLNVPADFGPIYVNGGDAFIQGNLSCSHCTVVLTNSDPTSTTIGNFKVNASSLINISAPTSGTFKGIAVYQDRRAGDTNPGSKINGNSGSVITGALYFPSQELNYNGTGNTTATCTMFVARRVNFSGNSGTTNKFKKLSDCSAEGLPSGGAVRMVRLVS